MESSSVFLDWKNIIKWPHEPKQFPHSVQSQSNDSILTSRESNAKNHTESQETPNNNSNLNLNNKAEGIQIPGSKTHYRPVILKTTWVWSKINTKRNSISPHIKAKTLKWPKMTAWMKERVSSTRGVGKIGPLYTEQWNKTPNITPHTKDQVWMHQGSKSMTWHH